MDETIPIPVTTTRLMIASSASPARNAGFSSSVASPGLSGRHRGPRSGSHSGSHATAARARAAAERHRRLRLVGAVIVGLALFAAGAVAALWWSNAGLSLPGIPSR